jgi:hypothetical protein
MRNGNRKDRNKEKQRHEETENKLNELYRNCEGTNERKNQSLNKSSFLSKKQSA